MEKIIVPSIIATSQEEVDDRVNKVKDHVEWMQLDVMDGKFVPTHSLDFDFTLPETNCKFEAHLMVEDPEAWLESRWDMVDTVLVHIETLEEPEKTIQLIKDKGKKAGLCINPKTEVDAIKPYLEIVQQVLVMTVNPGYYGSEFLPETLEKVRELRKLAPDIDIEVDGGMDAENIKKAAEAGANLFVSGSYIQKSKDVKEIIEVLKKQAGG